MSYSYKYTVTMPDSFKLPDGHAHLSALIKGAIAFQDGKPKSANPYEGGKSEGFREAWRRGYSAAEAGILKVSV